MELVLAWAGLSTDKAEHNKAGHRNPAHHSGAGTAAGVGTAGQGAGTAGQAAGTVGVVGTAGLAGNSRAVDPAGVAVWGNTGEEELQAAVQSFPARAEGGEGKEAINRTGACAD